MSVENLLYVLIGAQGGMLLLLLKHMFDCRDSRLDVQRIKDKIGMDER